MKIFRKRKKLDYWSASFELKKRIPELENVNSDYITDYLRGSNLEFYRIDKKKTPFYIRFTLPFAIIFLILALLFLPINFMITGSWNYEKVWIYNWFSALHLT